MNKKGVRILPTKSIRGSRSPALQEDIKITLVTLKKEMGKKGWQVSELGCMNPQNMR